MIDRPGTPTPPTERFSDKPRRRCLIIVGTRPEAIKLAPLIMRLRSSIFEPVVLATGQHDEAMTMLPQTFQIEPARSLRLLAPGQSLPDLTARAISDISAFIVEVAPDLVVVQGDTTSSFAGALSAFYHRVPVAHVEAGLRTADIYSPFPEELNRRLTTRLTTLHLAPTRAAVNNLRAEGVSAGDIVVTGNSVIDALFWALEQPITNASPALSEVLASTQPVLLITAHRRESWGSGLEAVARAVARVAKEQPHWLVVFPMHPNPLIERTFGPIVGHLPNVRLFAPLPYVPFCHLMRRSSIILTDSGGIQEEAPSLGKPVLVTRSNTERPEAIDAGVARLVGTDANVIHKAIADLMTDHDLYRSMSRSANPYGDGAAAERITAAMEWRFCAGARPSDFVAAG